MLVLSRKQDQQILIGENIKITVLKSKGNTVRLGIEAPRDIKVVRGELDSAKPTSPAESAQANFTVVFGDQPEKPASQSAAQAEPTSRKFDVVSYSDSPMPSHATFTQAPPANRISTFAKSKRHKETPSTKDTPAAGETVRFRDQLPQVLQHNRLKEIVARIASDAK